MVKLTLSSDFPRSLEYAKSLLIEDGWEQQNCQEDVTIFINPAIKTQKEARERLDSLNLLLCSTLNIHIEVYHGSISPSLG